MFGIDFFSIHRNSQEEHQIVPAAYTYSLFIAFLNAKKKFVIPKGERERKKERKGEERGERERERGERGKRGKRERIYCENIRKKNIAGTKKKLTEFTGKTF